MKPGVAPEVRRLLWLLPTFVLLWLGSIHLHVEALSPSLDSSWLGALSYFAAKRLQYGTEVIFTYGPLAYLGTGVYSGYLFRERVIWELGFKAINAGFLCWLITRLPRVWGAIFLALCLLFVLPALPEVSYFFSVTVLVVFLLRGSARIHVADILATMTITAVALMKYNYLALALFGVGDSTAVAFCKRSFGRASWIAGTFVTSFVLFWKWAGQDLANLGSYFRYAPEISLGYKESMGVPASSDLVVVLGLASLALVFAQLVFITVTRRDLSVTLIALFSGSEMFLNWQHGFIRADEHVMTFFELCPAAMLSIWATKAIDRLPKPPLYFMAAAGCCACFAGMYVQDAEVVTLCSANTAAKIQFGWNLVVHEPEIERDLELKLAEQKAQNSLPRIKAVVGHASVDVLGHEQAVAILNGLNYTPRPVFQSYNVYTPALLEENRNFYRSARAPAYALVKYQTIDGRYPAMDDAGAFRELIYNYMPLFTENSYSLWKKLPRQDQTQDVALSEGRTTFGQDVTIPQNGIVWMKLAIRKSLFGKIASFLYKPPQLQLAVTSKDGRNASYRLIPSMAAGGFVINPSLLTDDDLIATAQGAFQNSNILFAVRVASGDRKFFRDTISYRMTSVPPIPKQEPASATR